MRQINHKIPKIGNKERLIKPGIFNNFTEYDCKKIYEDQPTILPKYRNIKKYYKYLTDKERDILSLYYSDYITESVIAKRYKMSQGNVSYTLTKIKSKLKYLLTQIDIDIDYLKLYIGDIDRAILQKFVDTTSYVATLKSIQSVYPEVHFSFTIIRYGIKCTYTKVKKESIHNPNLIKYVKHLDYLFENVSVLHNLDKKKIYLS